MENPQPRFQPEPARSERPAGSSGQGRPSPLPAGGQSHCLAQAGAKGTPQNSRPGNLQPVGPGTGGLKWVVMAALTKNLTPAPQPCLTGGNRGTEAWVARPAQVHSDLGRCPLSLGRVRRSLQHLGSPWGGPPPPNSLRPAPSCWREGPPAPPPGPSPGCWRAELHRANWRRQLFAE